MGDFPTHNCTTTFDGDKIPVISPISQLDCGRPECQRRADMARRRTYCPVNHIEARIAEQRRLIQIHVEGLMLWELTLEAQTRGDGYPFPG